MSVNHMICDGYGDVLTMGVGEQEIDRMAQRMANDRGETVYVSVEGEDGDEQAVEPESTATTATRSYYGISWTYGRAVDANTGRPLWTLHRFASRAARDAWVEGRPTDYSGNSGYRESIAASDRNVRRDLQHEADNYGFGYVENHA